MPELGGPTTQSGILYQNSIAALFLGRLCDAASRPESDRVVHVRVETPDNVDDIVLTFADHHKTFIQAKEDIIIGDNSWRTLWEDFEKQFQSDKFTIGTDRLALWVGSYRDNLVCLQELCQRAISSETYEQWQSRITKKQKGILEKIKPIIHPEFLENSALLVFFKHIEVEIRPFQSLDRDEPPRWMPVTNFQSITIFRILRDKVGGASRIRGEFTSHQLQKSLISENPNLTFSKPSDIEEIKESIKSSSSLLRQHKNTIGNTNIHLRRSIVDEIVNWIISSSDDSNNLAMLIDQAGTGKTITLQDVLIDLESKGYDILALKADQQLSGITHLADISTRLDLTQSLEQILSRLSQLGRVAVLIDQIDALSLSLAHDQTTLDIVLDLIARLRRIPNLRILISCRLFDRNSDQRLKQIDTSHQFSLTQFTEDEVSHILSSMGVSFQDLPKSTQFLLQIPLHLNLFTLALENSTSRTSLFSVTSLQELYGTIWENIILKDDLRAPSKANRVEVLRLLTNFMAQHQVISVPKSVLLQTEFADLERATSWLASTGIIVDNKHNWTFIHQTFFDYCYARDFVENGGDLVEVILHSDQGLFYRPQLIQIITYMRGIRTPNYMKDLKTLLSADNLRFHLRDLLLRWFGSLPNPNESEWLFARRMLIDKENMPRFLQSMFGNPGWFTWLKNTLIPTWLSSEGYRDDTVFLYLVSMADLEITQLATFDLLRPYVGRGEEWDKRLLWFVSQMRNWYSVEAVEFYEQVIYRIPTLNKHDVYLIGLVAKTFPHTGVRILRFVLDLVLRQYDEKLRVWQGTASDQSSPTFSAPSIYYELNTIENLNLDEAFHFISQVEPLYFVQMLLPWLDSILSRREMPKETSLFYYFWDDLSGNWYNGHQSLEHAFIFSLIDALVIIAKSDPEFFGDVVTHLSCSPYRTPQYLIAHVFMAVPDIYASKAIQFILADRRRLELGDANGYDSRKLIQAIYPYLSDQERSELEAFILQPPLIHKSSGLNGLRWRGIEQFHLLQLIPSECLSQRAQRQLREWEHKFPGSKPADDPVTVISGWVQSPIPIEIAKRMTDRQWLKAMNKYHGGVEHREFLKGGAEQLSGVLQILIKENPQRYFLLLQQVNDNVDNAYVQAYINGLAESTASIEWLVRTIRRFSQHPNRNIKRTIAWSIEKRAKEVIPNDVIELLFTYLQEDPGEDEQSWTKGENHGDVYSSFLNSDRGASFIALMRIYDGQNTEEANGEKWKLIEFVESDSSTALHIGAIHELTYMIKLDRDRAINSFNKLIKGHEVLLESNYTREFIYWAFYKNYLRMYPHIVAMMHHKKGEVQEQGAQLACIAGLSNSSMESEDAYKAAQELAEQTTTTAAPISWKRGAAIVYAHNITGKPKDICILKLCGLLKEEDKQIHDSVGQVFYSLHEEHLFSLRNFIETYAKLSNSANYKFTEYLLDIGLLDPEWTLFIIQTILTNKDLFTQSPWSVGIDEITRLVFRIYTDPMVNNDVRKLSMDLFDILMEKSPGYSLKVLAEWDQR